MTTGEVVQSILTGVLVLITAVYVWRTHVISKASLKMAEEMREQRYGAVRPIIDIQREPSADPTDTLGEGFAAIKADTSFGLPCVLRNIGTGPAIDVWSFIVISSGERWRWEFDTLAINGTSSRKPLSMEQNGGDSRLVVHYRGVYGREFASSRRVWIEGKEGWKLGDLVVTPVHERAA